MLIYNVNKYLHNGYFCKVYLSLWKIINFGKHQTGQATKETECRQVAERANISRPTLLSIEKSMPGVAFESYAQVLFVLNLEKDLLKVAVDDTLGRKLQDAALIVKERAPKK